MNSSKIKLSSVVGEVLDRQDSDITVPPARLQALAAKFRSALPDFFESVVETAQRSWSLPISLSVSIKSALEDSRMMARDPLPESMNPWQFMPVSASGPPSRTLMFGRPGDPQASVTIDQLKSTQRVTASLLNVGGSAPPSMLVIPAGSSEPSRSISAVPSADGSELLYAVELPPGDYTIVFGPADRK
ncbi:MAG TPA: hypothetical protein VKU01_04610 [Bryobacteraceae bacterium]|nr:hypothetical protein [Bryobacteraceae bacterium]